MNTIPSLALVSGRVDHSSEDIESIPSMKEQLKNYSYLLWSLWRLGVRRLVALPHDRALLEAARSQLSEPPPIPRHQEPLLHHLITSQRKKHLANPLLQMAWSERMVITPPPQSPLQFDGVQLCFHDELIGVSDAFLIHYGPSRFEVSGYHSPMSSLSVPLGDELSALLLFRVPQPSEAGTSSYPIIGGSTSMTHSTFDVSHTGPRETCVVQINARGERIKGPWWPKLKL